jgi:RNA polymerase sigma factor (sigma-70 family)
MALRDDVVADTCSSVVLSIAKARGGQTFAGFVKGWYLNARRRALRELARQPDLLPETAATSDNLYSACDPGLDLVRQCWKLLTARERMAVKLRYFDEASSEQIAHALQVAPGNARRIVFNGLAKLRRCVGARQQEEVA